MRLMRSAELMPPVVAVPVPCGGEYARHIADLDRDDAEHEIEEPDRILPHEVEHRLGGEIREHRNDQVWVAQGCADDGTHCRQDRQQSHSLSPERGREANPVGVPRYKRPLEKVQGKSKGRQQR